MRRRTHNLCGTLFLAVLLASPGAQAQSELALSINPAYELDAELPVIAAPVEFNGILIDESTVELTWNPELLDGSQVDYFNVWDREELLGTTTDPLWVVEGIDRDYSYDFSVSAVLDSGTETRRSSRVYYDLPQLDSSLPDGMNQYLPPLENLSAEMVDADSVHISWDLPETFWSWASPSNYTYSIEVNGRGYGTTDELEYTVSGLADMGHVLIEVRAEVELQMYSRQPNGLQVDMSQPVGTVFKGYGAFNGLYGLRAEVYSSTAAELFWESSRSMNASFVYINGRLVARMLEGKSIFIEGLPAGERLLVSVGEAWPYQSDDPLFWPLLHDYPLMHTWLQMPGDVVDNSGTVAPVSGLRVDVYSNSAAEIFWDRADMPLARYRVYLDGELLQETDGVSLFLEGLATGSTHTAGIVMVGDADNESELQEIEFTTSGGSSAVSEACLVTGAHATVYSATAAEVFWDRKPAAGQRYELTLNGEFLTETDAVSWFGEGLDTAAGNRMVVSVVGEACEGEGVEVVF